MLDIAILGSGNGGFAAAADLTVRGHRVRLWGRSGETLEPVRTLGGVRFTGVLGEGVAAVAVVTTDLAEAVAGADLVMVCLPATALPDLAPRLAPCLRPGQPVLLNPGSTGGALFFRRALQEAGTPLPLVVGETNTLTYICRKQGPAEIRITNRIDNALAAVFPSTAQPEFARLADQIYGRLEWVDNVLVSSLCNLNAVLHPPGMVLGAAWIEATGGDFTFYDDAATPAVARVMADLDRERIAVAAAYGYRVNDLITLFSAIGSTAPAETLGGSYLRALKESAPNKLIKAPPSLSHRYLLEDTRFGLVPMEALGKAAGVGTPVISALIDLECSMVGEDLRTSGMNASALGLAGLSAAEIRRLAEEG